MNVRLNLVTAIIFAVVLEIKSDCRIGIKTDLTAKQPLLLKPRITPNDAFIEPTDNRGQITLRTADTLQVACPGSEVVLGGNPQGVDILSVECSTGSFFRRGSTWTGRFRDIQCQKTVESTAQRTGSTCAVSFDEIGLGFQVGRVFLPQILVCFDTDNLNAKYSEHTISKMIMGSQCNVPRETWDKSFCRSVDIDDLYTTKTQRDTINQLLGLPISSTKYIQDDRKHYLAKGHLAPKCDFVYGSQQGVTFFYVNAAPQWQNINNANWKAMELRIKKLANDRNFDLKIYTGTYGIATLKHDKTSALEDLFLYVSGSSKKITVPELFWKIVYEPKSQLGVALINMNNPYETVSTVCTDVFSQLNSWMNLPKRTDKDAGYIYACTVSDFRRVVDYIPSIHVTGLLK